MTSLLRVFKNAPQEQMVMWSNPRRAFFYFFTTNVFHAIILISRLSMAGLPLEKAY